MKKSILLFCIVTCYASSFAQTAQFKKYYVQFRDKNNSPYSISNPLAYLSPRAIARRVNQNIAIAENDLPVNPAYIDSVANNGAAILNPTKWLNGVTIATSDTNVLLKIEALPFVKDVIAVSIDAQPRSVRKKYSTGPKHTRSGIQQLATTYKINYGSALNQIEMLNGMELQYSGYLGQGMVIASLDDGYTNLNNNIAFDSMLMNNQLLGWHDFVSLDNSDMFNLSDYGTHGCETMSTMASNLPGQLVGTAPKASFWLLRTENDSTENPVEMYNWVSGAEFADSVGADIITSSLGYSQFDDPAFNYTYADMNGKTSPCAIAAAIAASKGMIVCNSAGNEGGDSWHYITTPGDADSILTMGAVDPYGNYAPFSSQGPTFDGRIKPDVAAQGSPAAIIDPYSGTVTYDGGTSFSCPIIAGMTACLWQAHPDKTNMQIMQAIRQSASIYNDPNDMIGYGIPNFGLADIILSVSSPSIEQSNLPFVYPDPFTQNINIVYFNDTTLNETVQIYNIVGQLMYEQIIPSAKGYQKYSIEGLNTLSHGVYFLFIGNAVEQQRLKIMKM